MNKATEDDLSILHKRVTENMLAALEQSDQAIYLLDKYKDELPKDVKRFLSDLQSVNPSLLASATKFLKDNNISCDPAEDEHLSDLEQRLKDKRSGTLANIEYTQ